MCLPVMLLERCSYCAMVCASINFSSVLWRPRTQVPLSGGRWCYVFFFLACDNSLVHLTSINISLRPQEEPLLIRHNICLFYFVLLISLSDFQKEACTADTYRCTLFGLPPSFCCTTIYEVCSFRGSAYVLAHRCFRHIEKT